jgi:hypothetical protein
VLCYGLWLRGYLLRASVVVAALTLTAITALSFVAIHPRPVVLTLPRPSAAAPALASSAPADVVVYLPDTIANEWAYCGNDDGPCTAQTISEDGSAFVTVVLAPAQGNRPS